MILSCQMCNSIYFAYYVVGNNWDGDTMLVFKRWVKFWVFLWILPLWFFGSALILVYVLSFCLLIVLFV